MSFDNKLAAFFTGFSLEMGSPPTRNLIYLYADYVELLSLFSNQNYVTLSDVLDRFKDEGIIRQKDHDKDQSEANDENERFVTSIFSLLNDRAQIFGSAYPYFVSESSRIILKEDASLNDKHKVYLFMLLSSSLDIFADFQPELTTEFEILSAEVLRNFLPPHAVVKSFGKNSDYTGTAVQKITALSADVSTPLDNEAFSQISEKGMQEKGLDVVGWIPFADTVANYLSVFVQCACGKDWRAKLAETSRYNNYFKFHRLRPLHSMFLPYSLIDYNRNIFFRNDEFGNNCLVFERKRIINYLLDSTFFAEFNSKKLVEECIKYEEKIV